MSVEEVGAIWSTLGKVGAWEVKKAYGAAQNLGMRYQNWRHKGAGADSSTPAVASSGKGGKQWGSVESTNYFHTETTMYTHTKKIAKENR